MKTNDAWEEFVGEEVVDSDAFQIGTLSCYWESADGLPTFLGISCPVDPQHTHVVPARGARLNERRGYIQLPYLRAAVQNAPCLDCDEEIRPSFVNTVYTHYTASNRSRREMAEMAREQDELVAHTW